MDKNKLLNQVLTILPENIENIESCEIIHDSIILSTDSVKYTIKIYSKSLQDSSQCKTFLNKNTITGEVNNIGFYKSSTSNKLPNLPQSLPLYFNPF